jgi:hypothetical protein
MNNQSFIQFKKKRNLGDMLSDTIKFLSLEWKPFSVNILKAAFVPILIACAAMLYYVMNVTSFSASITKSLDNDSFFDLNFSELLLPALAFLLSLMVAYALIAISAMLYIKSYIENNGVLNFEEVNDASKEKFWPYILLFILNIFIVFFGFLFFFLPGIYFGVVLSLSICLLVFQNKSVLEAINDSFILIKDHWWETFGIILVFQIIIGIIGGIASMPVSLYQLSEIGAGVQTQNEVLAIFNDPIYLLLLVFSYFVKFFLYMVSIVFTVFIYYDIKEQKKAI